MAACHTNPRSDLPSTGSHECLAPTALSERLEEEIKRAERHGTPLSCLLVVVENLDEMAREHGGELREQTLSYIAGALRRELRGFDRIGRPSPHELLLVLPGADGPRGEIVARRVLDRVRAIKVEASGTRRPLRVSVGLAAWRDGSSAEDLLGHTRSASRGVNGEETPSVTSSPPPVGRELPERSPAERPEDASPGFGEPTSS
jgi:diguanylate cyclase (GGDEF)-like protein